MTCRHCLYEWSARVDEPKACPRCKSRQDAPASGNGTARDHTRARKPPAAVSAIRSAIARAAWGKLSADERKARQQRVWAKRKAAGRDNPRVPEQIQGA